MSVMISLRDMRLSNTSGHCVLVKAQTPTTIPPLLREDAIMAGMIDCDEPAADPEEVATPTPVAVAAEPIPTPPETVEAPAKVEDTGLNDAEQLTLAIRKLLVRDNGDDFKNDGTPKVLRVVAEMPPECARPTATQVAAAYEELQDDPELAITD